MKIVRVLLVAAALVGAGRASAQYPQPPPSQPPPSQPPPYYPPPPPPPPPQAPPAQYRYPLPPVANNVLRLSAGVSLLSAGYDCWYYGYYYGSCGYGYNSAFPVVNLDADIGLSPYLALTVGGNVMWGSLAGVDTTIWEPHLDLLLRGSPYSDIRGRFRIGVGILAAHASSSALYGSSSDTGAAFRIGAGVSFLNRSPVGIGLDVIFEAGSIGGNSVSTLQMLLGPELHF